MKIQHYKLKDKESPRKTSPRSMFFKLRKVSNNPFIDMQTVLFNNDFPRDIMTPNQYQKRHRIISHAINKLIENNDPNQKKTLAR